MQPIQAWKISFNVYYLLQNKWHKHKSLLTSIYVNKTDKYDMNLEEETKCQSTMQSDHVTARTSA